MQVWCWVEVLRSLCLDVLGAPSVDTISTTRISHALNPSYGGDESKLCVSAVLTVLTALSIPEPSRPMPLAPNSLNLLSLNLDHCHTYVSL